MVASPRVNAPGYDPEPSPSHITSDQMRTCILFASATAALAILVGSSWGGFFAVVDADWYVKIAQGASSSVMAPFSARQLGPLLCRALTEIFPISVYTAFIIEGVLSLLALLLGVGCLLRAGKNTLLLLAVGSLSFWSILFNGLALPDLWFAALLVVFLLLLDQNRFLAAALMFFPLYFSRESTLLVLLCFLIVGWRRIKPLHSVAAIAASIAAMQLVKHLSTGGPMNREQVSPTAYLIGKIPWNLMKNVVGLPLWNNLNHSCAVPEWQMNLHLGGVTQVGVCAYQPGITFWTLRLALSSFGLMPLLLFYLWRRKRVSIADQNTMMRFCILYGAVSFLLAPELGASVPRLFGYAWPLFVVAVPVLAIRHLRLPRNLAVGIVLLNLAISWSEVLIQPDPENLAAQSAACLLLAGAYAAAWALLRQAPLAIGENFLVE